MIRVAAAVCIRNGKVLLASRPVGKPPAGWEFPGGKFEPGETAQQAVVRELKEELDYPVYPLDIIYRLRKATFTIDFVRVIPADPEAVPRPCENQEAAWVELTPEAPAELLSGDLEFWNFLTHR